MLKKLALIALATGLAAQAARLVKNRLASAAHDGGATKGAAMQRRAVESAVPAIPSPADDDALEPAVMRRVRKAADRVDGTTAAAVAPRR